MLAVADDAAARPKCELAHVFREYGADYRRTHRLPFSHAGSCKPSNSVAPPTSVATWSSATYVALNTPPMTRAETVIIPNVNP